MLDSDIEGPGFKSQSRRCRVTVLPISYQFCCLVNRGIMGVNSLRTIVTRQHRSYDLNPDPTAPESSMLTTQLLSHPSTVTCRLLISLPVSTSHSLADVSMLTMPYQCTYYLLHTHTHPFNGPLLGTTRVSRYQKGKTNLNFTEARDSEWQWHQVGSMQVCTSLQTDSHASTPPLSFYRPDALPAAQPTASKH